ncbi:hypothetical protein IMCC20628_04883 (plasmid) [Hoeflea sp. IMCC20628]|nr:hypothetical protein IMCC20628_04883 [Hoeflea sp. IMCC20628]
MLTLNDIHRSVEAPSPSFPVENASVAAPHSRRVATSDPSRKSRQIGLVSALR